MMEIINNNINYHKEPYSFYINYIIENDIAKDKQELYANISSAYNNCFVLAKQNKIHEANIAYQSCSELKKQITNNIRPWIDVFCQPYLSYYYYRIGSYKEAIKKTNGTIDTSRRLQKEGYSYLFFAEIQQIHNLSRIYFQIGNDKKAISFCIQGLEEMVKQGNCWTTAKIINQVPEIELIKATQYGMIIQITTETCNRIIKGFENDIALSEKWMDFFLTPIMKLSFEHLSPELRYKNLDIFFKLMSNINKKGIDGINDLDTDSFHFIETSGSDKELLRVLYNYINILDRENSII